MAKKYLLHQIKDVKEFVKSTKGKTFKVSFIKDDGTIRKMRCHVDLNFKPKKKKPGEPVRKLPSTSVFVFDEKKEEYRSFHAGRVIFLVQLG